MRPVATKVEMPQIELSNINMMVVDAKDGDDQDIKVLVLGPVLLTLPLDAESSAWLTDEIKQGKVSVIPAAALAALPKPPGS